MVSAVHRIGRTPVEELILAELDQALPPNSEVAFEEHLRGCVACRELRVRHRRLHERLRTPPEPRTVERAREQIWAGIASRRSAPRRSRAGPLARLAFVAAVLLAAAAVSPLLAERVPVAAPAREEVTRLGFDLPGGGAGTLFIEQGSALARAGEEVGVGARAELLFDRAVPAGAAEIRFQGEGDHSYGVLGAAPDLAGVTRMRFGGTFPRPPGGLPVTYRVWVHLEAQGLTLDTQMLHIDVLPLPRGERARVR